jgi:hypothetical protein
MDIRVNDDTIPKKTINIKLKRQYVRKKSHGRKIRDRRQDLVARQPTQKWKQYRSCQLHFHNSSFKSLNFLITEFLGEKSVKYAMQALQLVLSDDDESCYEIQLALK